MIEVPASSRDTINASNKANRRQKGISVIDFPKEYTCVDLETTGFALSSDEIIEIAALRVKDGVICDRFSSLVRPPKDVKIPPNVEQLTGITNDMLSSAPCADSVIPAFHRFIGYGILVGHNINFDMNFIYEACQRYNLFLTNNFVDTMRIARKILPQLEHHRLSDVIAHFGIVQNTAHRAETDVIATIECFEAMKSLVLQTKSIEDFVNEFNMSSRQGSSHSARNYHSKKNFRPSEIITASTADQSHPLYGKSVVFTGELSISRVEAAQMAADVGAAIKNSVSRKTDFLVVGQQDQSLVGTSGISAKEKRAHELNALGQGTIKILSEQEFVKIVRKEEGGL